MAEAEKNDLRKRIIAYLETVDMAKSRDIADALGEKKRQVDTIVKELAKEDRIEFLYLGTSYVKLK